MFTLSSELIDAYRHLDTGAVSNAIETFGVRLRNEGFTNGGLRAAFDDLPPVVGHAVTARIRSSTPPPVGDGYHDRTDWWTYILTLPDPRIVVVQDVDDKPGLGAFVGEVHANILAALGCVAYVTNGSVRDLPHVHGIGFQLFAPTVSVSHAFVHMIDFGGDVEICGLKIGSGDLLYGDAHGVLSIPPAIAADVPAVAQKMRKQEHEVIQLCQSSDFSLDKLRAMVKELA